MGLGSRKLLVWLVSLAAVIAAYLLVNLLSKTPQIDVPTETTDTVTQESVDEFDQSVGKVGDVGVGTVQKAKYIHLNAKRQIDREFGFEKLLHEQGNEWEIEKPFMNVYRRNFKCLLTADRGNVRVETALGKPDPKDAILTGNVVIHILPEGGSDIRESFIYLDDVLFVSEKSQFSTAGPVKFTNEDARMLGTGLELVYSDQAQRIEFLRIIDLESLRLRSSDTNLFSQPSRNEEQEPTATAEVDSKPPSTADIKTAETGGEIYRCLLDGNVTIETPQQQIFADQISINNIISNDRSDEADSGSENKTVASAEIGDSGIADKNASAAAGRDDMPAEESFEQFGDIVVTCDNGILVVPMDSSRSIKDFVKPKAKAAAPEQIKSSIDRDDERITFVAQRIDYDVPTGDIVAGGSSELWFYANDITGPEAKRTKVPVKITAEERIKFTRASNRVVFAGDCRCEMLREDLDFQQKYVLSGPKLTVDLSGDKNLDIEHVRADGGLVRLATIKTAQNDKLEKLLGGIELKCNRFDFDNSRQLFSATGPGVVKVDNANISEPQKDLGRFSLQRPCYAFVRDFETLKYNLETNKVVADTKQEQIIIDYIPIVQGRYGQQVAATAGQIEAMLYQPKTGKTELLALSATDGVTYQQERDRTPRRKGRGQTVQFVGSDFFYDANKSTIVAWGDQAQPCLFNGALVDEIEYNLKTEIINAQIAGPGALSPIN